MPKKKTTQKDDGFSLISREKLLSLYARTLRCRLFEEFVASTPRRRRAASAASAAAAAAVCIDRKAGDLIVAGAHDLLPAFVQGRSAASTLAGLKKDAAQARKQFAAQLARAQRIGCTGHGDTTRKIALIFRGPATEQQWQALLETASAKRLPMILVSGGDGAKRSRALSRELPSIAVDRDDPVALYRVASEGIAHARRGNGPTLIRCIPWTLAEASDAVANVEAYLAQKGISPARRKAKVVAEFQQEINGLRRLRRK